MTCLLQSFQKCNFLEKLTPFELNNFMKLKTIDEQFFYLAQLSMLPLKISNLTHARNWSDVEEYCKNVIGDGVLLMWGPLNQIGHAVPVLKGKINWLFQDTNNELSQYINNINISNIKSKY